MSSITSQHARAYQATEINDPLVGTQEETDSPAEARATSPDEVVLAEVPEGLAVKSRAVAGLLGIFFGWLGLHRFYLGYHEVGSFQLALSLIAIATVIVAGLAMDPSSSAGDLALTASGVLALIGLWGFFEGCGIFIGGLSHDAHLRPLK